MTLQLKKFVGLALALLMVISTGVIAANVGENSKVTSPVAEAGPDQTVQVGDEVQFDGSGSYDPDGTIVGYEWDFGDGATYSSTPYHVVATQQVTSAPYHELDPRWRPDGQQIAISAWTTIYYHDIIVMNTDGTGQQQLTTTSNLHERFPMYRPDGGKIAYVRGTVDTSNGDYDIWVMNPDGSNKVALTSNPSYDDRNPDWSPDGSKIYFTSDRTGNYELWVMDSDGSNLMQLTSGIGKIAIPRVSPNGDKVGFSASVGNKYSAMVLDLTTGMSQTLVSDPTLNIFFSSWSPDGNYILYSKTGGTGSSAAEHWMIQEDGTDNTQLTFDGTIKGGGDWSPDSNRIAYRQKDGSYYNIYIINIAGEPTTSHVYTQPGIYTVSLTVMDDDGATDTDTCVVTVNGVVDLSIGNDDIILSVESPKVGESVTIEAVVHGDPSTESFWKKYGVVLDLGGTGEDSKVYAPSVIRLDNGTYVMWYVGKAPGAPNNYCGRIFRAFSYNGIDWYKEGLVMDYDGAYEEHGLETPHVYVDAKGIYQMWYTGVGYNGGYRYYIHRAVSTDGGFTWQKLGRQLNYGSSADPDGAFSPYVMFDGGEWHLWYSGVEWHPGPDQSRVCHAHKVQQSDPWVKDGVVLSNDGPYDSLQARNPWIIPTDDGYEMYYTGFVNEPPVIGRILHATSPDGFSWTRNGIVLEASLPEEGCLIGYSSVIPDANPKMWYSGHDGTNMRIFYAEQMPGEQGIDATCTVSFYLDSVAPENLMYQECDVFVPADGTANVSCDWTPAISGNHTIIVEIDNITPPDSNLMNNAASKDIFIEGFQVDLFIQDEDISLSEPNPGQGEIITIQASVHNRGGLGTGTDWVKKGVVLQNNSFSTGLDYPYILYHEGKYKMWYVGRDGGFGEIYYATSPDGYTWTEHGCVLPVPVGLNYAVAPSVLIEDDGTYKMWFTCQDGNWKARTYLATSYNGITWTNQGVALGIGSPGSSDDVYVVQAKVFKDGDKYKLYYKSYDSSSNKYFMFATSNDGYTWTKHGVVMDLPSGFTNMECPIVFKNDDGTYTMWYHLWQDSLGEIYRSHSQDGIVWSLGILDLGVGIPGELDDYFVVCPHLITDPISGNDWMYYTGSDGSEHRVFLAEKEIEYMGYDATCTVSFYLDSVASENLMYQECDVFVPADGTANVSCDWTPTLAGEHTIIVNISDSNPPESDLTNNQASKAVTVTPGTPACLDITKVKVSGIEEGYTFTYYEWVLQINITNTGGYLAQDVIVKDTLPAELVLLSLEPTSGIATYLGMCSNAGTRSNQKPVIWPIEKATHIEWIVGDLSPGQTESLTMTICTGTNPAGKQEFTSPGIYNLNDGAWAKGYDSLTGTQISAGPTPPITVNVSDLFRIPPLSGHWSQY